MYVCLCHGIRDGELREAVSRGCDSFEQLQASTGVSTCCRTCEPTAREILQETLASRAPSIQAA